MKNLIKLIALFLVSALLITSCSKNTPIPTQSQTLTIKLTDRVITPYNHIRYFGEGDSSTLVTVVGNTKAELLTRLKDSMTAQRSAFKKVAGRETKELTIKVISCSFPITYSDFLDIEFTGGVPNQMGVNTDNIPIDISVIWHMANYFKQWDNSWEQVIEMIQREIVEL